MSARETLRTTLVNLLEEEMGEKYPLPKDDQDLRESSSSTRSTWSGW